MAGALLCQDLAGGSVCTCACSLPGECHQASALCNYLWPAEEGGPWVAVPPLLFLLCLQHPQFTLGANSGAGSSLGKPLPPSPEVSGSPERKEGGEGKQTGDKRLVVGREQEAGRLGEPPCLSWLGRGMRPKIIPQGVCERGKVLAAVGVRGTPASVGTTGPALESEAQGLELPVPLICWVSNLPVVIDKVHILGLRWCTPARHGLGK